MELTDVQKQSVAEWVKEGASLSDIQKRLSEEFEVSMTYMDVRFLILDLGLDVQDKPEPVKEAPPQDLDNDAAPELGPPPLDDAPSAAGGVSVEVDRVTKPGTIVSGNVTFSDGSTSAWALDQFGRLALDPGESGSRPSPEDLQAFQEELRSVLEKRGF
jgi:hypothetical protein